jgi:hypothetical protein
LLALINPKRLRENWEMVRPAMVDGRRPTESNPAPATPLSCFFEDVNEYDAERALGGSLYCLAELANDLADNISFGELFRTKRGELEKAFGGLDQLSRLKREFRHFLPVVEPAAVAGHWEAGQPTVWETLFDDEKRIIRGDACSEVVAIRITWRFTDSEIVGAMKKFVRANRPRKSVQRKKGSRQESPRAALDALSAMRLASYVPKTSVATAGGLSAYLSEEPHGIGFKPSAIGLFEMVRLGGHGKHIAESNFDALIVEARELFRRELPFGEDAANAPTLAERIMTKSVRISS